MLLADCFCHNTGFWASACICKQAYSQTISTAQFRGIFPSLCSNVPIHKQSRSPMKGWTRQPHSLLCEGHGPGAGPSEWGSAPAHFTGPAAQESVSKCWRMAGESKQRCRLEGARAQQCGCSCLTKLAYELIPSPEKRWRNRANSFCVSLSSAHCTIQTSQLPFFPSVWQAMQRPRDI